MEINLEMNIQTKESVLVGFEDAWFTAYIIKVKPVVKKDLIIRVSDENIGIFRLLTSGEIARRLDGINNLEILIGYFPDEQQFRIPSGSIELPGLQTLNLTFYMNKACSGVDFEKILQIGSIPSTVKTLYIDHRLVRGNPLELIPASVVDLQLNSWWSEKGQTKMVPNTVQILKISCSYSEHTSVISPGCIPDSVTYLKIFEFYSPIFEPQSIPKSVKKLNLSFSGPLIDGIIPDSVEKLEFSGDFDHEIPPGWIPNSVKTIIFPAGINIFEIMEYGQQFVKGAIPDSVRKLVIPSRSLPKSMIQDRDILPSGLIHLETLERTLPSSLINISFYFGISNLIPYPVIPESVKYMLLQLKKGPNSIPDGSLPDTMESLSLHGPIGFSSIGHQHTATGSTCLFRGNDFHPINKREYEELQDYGIQVPKFSCTELAINIRNEQIQLV
eukprot:gene2907-3623_t